jgi:hypothetical protein
VTSASIVNTPSLDRAPRRRSTARDALACGIALITTMRACVRTCVRTCVRACVRDATRCDRQRGVDE